MTEQYMAAKGQDSAGQERGGDWPGWVPVATRNYLAHVESGQSIRALAKAADVHPSTILRRVRRVESLRDDPLLDAALRRVVGDADRSEVAEDDPLLRQAAPTLRQLLDQDSSLLVSRDMDKALVVRTGRKGQARNLAIIDRSLAEEMALRRWITALEPDARVQRYRITHAGRLLVRGGALAVRNMGFAEAQAGFAFGPEGLDDDRLHHMRPYLDDTPLMALARRRDENGVPFLSREEVSTGRRLREDFDLAQHEDGSLTDWDGFLERLSSAAEPARAVQPAGIPGAGERLRRALLILGPGMADVALRCCCLLEGLETVEKRLGWSARSGKVVLKIALARLQQHYRTEDGRSNPLIG